MTTELVPVQAGRRVAGLTYVHAGAFSGSAISLRDALLRQVPLRSVDLQPMARDVSLWPARVRGIVEARAAQHCPWTKTAAWSHGLQRRLARRGVFAGAPLLVVQSLPAFVLPPRTRYAVYTDRVGLEGAAVGGPHGSRFSSGWLAREEALLRGADRVYVMGPSTLEVLVQQYGLPPDRVVVLGAGPNAVLGPARPRTGCRNLLFVGTQWELKGGPELLAAFSRLRRGTPELRLTLVGSAPPHPLPEGVHALGRVGRREMDAVYDAADAVVIPTHMEAFGIALVESLMKGLPCVCSTVGNQPWIVQRAGVTVPPGDVPALVAALEQLVTGYARLHSEALARGAELRRTMAWDRVASRIVADLTDVPGRRQ